MIYVFEEIMRVNLLFFSGVFKDIGILFILKNNVDKFVVFNFIVVFGDNGFKYVILFFLKFFVFLNDKDEVVCVSVVEIFEKLVEKNKKFCVIVIEKFKEMKDLSDLVKYKVEEVFLRFFFFEKE